MTPMQGQPCDARYAAHEATYASCAALSSESLDGWIMEGWRVLSQRYMPGIYLSISIGSLAGSRRRRARRPA